MYLHREDLKKMLEILEKFPKVDVVDVQVDNSSGIGSHTTMQIVTQVNGIDGTLEVVISSVENW